MSYQPSTYTAAEIPSSKVQLLVKDGEQDILDTIESWSTGKLKVEDESIVGWIDKGLAFWMNPEVPTHLLNPPLNTTNTY
jgi:hypothetical protein